MAGMPSFGAGRRIGWSIAVAMAMAIACAGCATPYAAKGPLGGFSDRKLSADRYEVEFTGNGHTSAALVANMYLYRCAELTVQNKFDVFRSRRPDDATPDPWSQSLSGSADPQAPVPFRSSGGVHYMPVYVPGGTVHISKMTGIVHMARYADVPQDAQVLDARKVMSILAPVVLGNARDKPIASEEILRQAAVNGRGSASSMNPTGTSMDDLRGLIKP